MKHATDRVTVRVPYTSRLYAYTRMERRDRFILLRSTCTVKMQSRLARQRIHQRTRAHETTVPLLRRDAVVVAVVDADVDAEGVVYPALPLYYQLPPILSTKDNFLCYTAIGRLVFLTPFSSIFLYRSFLISIFLRITPLRIFSVTICPFV